MSEQPPEARIPGLPEQTTDDSDDTDDTDHGWGERPTETDPDDLARFLSDRPPHHGDV